MGGRVRPGCSLRQPLARPREGQRAGLGVLRVDVHVGHQHLRPLGSVVARLPQVIDEVREDGVGLLLQLA
eukprot:835742-Pyramimonas_sp.AAC.1